EEDGTLVVELPGPFRSATLGAVCAGASSGKRCNARIVDIVAVCCGDGVVSHPDEKCDPQASPTGCPAGTYCNETCTACCGDGVVDPGEKCDPPGSRAGCPVGAFGLQVCKGICTGCCGDGVLDPGERCDPPFDVACCSLGASCNGLCTGYSGDGWRGLVWAYSS